MMTKKKERKIKRLRKKIKTLEMYIGFTQEKIDIINKKIFGLLIRRK